MIAPSNTLVCDATVVLNLGHRGGLEDLTAALAQDRKLVVTTEVAREVSLDDPSFYQGFLARYFVIDSRPLLRVAAVENAAMPMRWIPGKSACSRCVFRPSGPPALMKAPVDALPGHLNSSVLEPLACSGMGSTRDG
jgi:hypothetical protein